MDVCVICNQSLDQKPSVVLTEKGCASINTASVAQKCAIKTAPGQLIHAVCRRDFIHSRNITDNDENNNITASRTLRSCTDCFDFKNNCIFCAKNAKFDHR